MADDKPKGPKLSETNPDVRLIRELITSNETISGGAAPAAAAMDAKMEDFSKRYFKEGKNISQTARPEIAEYVTNEATGKVPTKNRVTVPPSSGLAREFASARNLATRANAALNESQKMMNAAFSAAAIRNTVEGGDATKTLFDELKAAKKDKAKIQAAFDKFKEAVKTPEETSRAPGDITVALAEYKSGRFTGESSTSMNLNGGPSRSGGRNT